MDTILSQCQTLSGDEVEALIKSLGVVAEQKKAKDERKIVKNLAPDAIYVSTRQLEAPYYINCNTAELFLRLMSFDRRNLSDWRILGLSRLRSNKVNNLLQKDNFWPRILAQIKHDDVIVPYSDEWKTYDSVRGAITTDRATIKIFYYWRDMEYPPAGTKLKDLEGHRWTAHPDHIESDPSWSPSARLIKRKHWLTRQMVDPWFIISSPSDASTSNV
jgi:hypothetical protein